MSIVFFGTPEFAVPSLTALIAAGERVSLVVTQADKPQGRGHRIVQPPVKTVALNAGITVVQPERLKDDHFAQTLREHNPEFMVVVAYGRILPGTLLGIPRHGCINVHASLLPRYRGAAPIAWAIINGEAKTGVTTMLMDEGLDTGPTLLGRELPISPDDTTATLGRTLSLLGSSLLVETLDGIRRGTIQPVPQQGEPSYAMPLRKEDGRIDWARTAVEISNRVRGMQPWPGAYCHLFNERLTVLKAAPRAGLGRPGVIAEVGKNELLIGTGEGLLAVLEVQPSGKRSMPMAAFLQGRRLAEGLSLS